MPILNTAGKMVLLSNNIFYIVGVPVSASFFHSSSQQQLKKVITFYTKVPQSDELVAT
jgi:hypothetical protein